MAKIEITMERVQRVAMEFDATEQEIEWLKRGHNPFVKELEDNIENGDLEYDWAACNLDTGQQIVDWE